MSPVWGIFIGLFSIGDIRRAILNNIDINTTLIITLVREDILFALDTDSIASIKKRSMSFDTQALSGT